MDHAVKTSKTKPWDKLRFENEELECLYQRYTLKMQRFSVIGVVTLFVILCLVMVTLSLVFVQQLTLHVSISFLLCIFCRCGSLVIVGVHYYIFVVAICRMAHFMCSIKRASTAHAVCIQVIVLFLHRIKHFDSVELHWMADIGGGKCAII